MNTALLHPPLSAATLGSMATDALISEVTLPGKPGLVGPDGCRGHADMDMELMIRSAHVLQPTFEKMAAVAATRPIGVELRELLGSIGRAGEADMMAATNGTNTHRGAIWNLGLHVMAVSHLQNYAERPKPGVAEITESAGRLARLPDSWLDSENRPGKAARKKYGVGGAVSEAGQGFPHVRAILDEIAATPGHLHCAQLRGLLRSMSTLDDTCLLHRGGRAGLQFVQQGAAELLHRPGDEHTLSWPALSLFDRELTHRELSAGGSADLLACAMFLASFEGDNNAAH